jgi:hypothetical protein
LTSYKPEKNVFTENSIGGSPGDSNGLIRKGIPGGTLLSAYPQDNIHGVSLPDCHGGSFAGSDTNLAHSIKGSGMVVDEYPRDGKSGKKEI